MCVTTYERKQYHFTGNSIKSSLHEFHFTNAIVRKTGYYLCRMEYFKRLRELLQIEKEADRRSYNELTENLPIADRREAGITWYPIAIRDTELGRGDYLTVEVERTT